MLETQGRIDTQPRFRCINHDKKGMVLDFESVRVQKKCVIGYSAILANSKKRYFIDHKALP